MQNVEEKPWKNEELRKLEEALPRLKRVRFGKGFVDFTKETRGEIVEFLEKWKMAATSLHDDVLLDTKECYE